MIIIFANNSHFSSNEYTMFAEISYRRLLINKPEFYGYFAARICILSSRYYFQMQNGRKSEPNNQKNVQITGCLVNEWFSRCMCNSESFRRFFSFFPIHLLCHNHRTRPPHWLTRGASVQAIFSAARRIHENQIKRIVPAGRVVFPDLFFSQNHLLNHVLRTFLRYDFSDRKRKNILS